MPKTLREPTPSSAIARLLDRDAAARALNRNPTSGGGASHSERVDLHSTASAYEADPLVLVKREFILSSGADETLARLVAMYRRATRTRLSASHLFRAMMLAVEHCLPMLEREATRLGPLRLPSNGRGYEHQRAAFEQRVAESLVAAMRAAAAYQAAACESAPTQNRPGR